MNLTDLSQLDILNDLSELHSQFTNFHAPEQQNKRWEILQSFLKRHKTIKGHLESCLKMTPEAATDFLFTEIVYESFGVKLSPKVIAMVKPVEYAQYRPMVEDTVNTVLTLYRERAAQNKPKRKLRGKKS